MRCEHWDCGWCYAPYGAQSNDDNGQCNRPKECEDLRMQQGSNKKQTSND